MPGRAGFDLYHRDASHGLKLHVQRVFITDRTDQFLPHYLRFIRGVVDSGDLSLNVSREILHNSQVIGSMKTGLTKRVLDMLGKLVAEDEDKYAKFWSQFGEVLKEGPAEESGNMEKIAALLRFASTHDASGKPSVSLADYVARMKDDQDKIYYLIGESHNQLQGSPYLEVFRKKGVEVLMLSDRIDEWMMGYLREFNGKSFVDVSRGDLDLGELDSSEDKAAQEQAAKACEGLVGHLKAALGDRSPTCASPTA